MTDIFIFLQTKHQSFNISQVPKDLITDISTNVKLLFSPQSIMIDISSNFQFRKLFIFQDNQISSLGLLSFLSCLQLDLIGALQIIRFINHSSHIKQIPYQVSQFLDRFIHHFQGKDLFDIITCVCRHGFGLHTQNYLMKDNNNIVFQIITNHKYDYLNSSIFKDIISYYKLQSIDCMNIIKHVSQLDDFIEIKQQVLFFAINNEVQFENENIILKIEDQSTFLKFNQLNFSSITKFIKLNEEFLPPNYYCILLKVLLKLEDKYYKYIWKMVCQMPLLKFDNIQLYQFIIYFLKQVDYWSQRHFEQISFYLNQNIVILELNSIKCKNSNIQAKLEELQLFQSIILKQDCYQTIIQDYDNIVNIIPQIIMLSQNSLKNKQKLQFLSIISFQMSFLDLDEIVLYFMQKIVKTESLIIKFPQINYKILQILLAIQIPSYEQSLTGFIKTTAQQTKLFYQSYCTSKYDLNIFNISQSQLYIVDSIYTLSLVVEDYSNIQQFSLSFVFSPQNLYIQSELENILTSLILQLNGLANQIILGDEEKIKSYYIFTYQEQDVQQQNSNSNNIDLILLLYKSVLKPVIFLYLLLNFMDNTIKQRYFDQIYQLSLLFSIFSKQINLLTPILDDSNKSCLLISSCVIYDQITQYLNQNQTKIIILFNKQDQFETRDHVQLQNLILLIDQNDMRLKQFVCIKLVNYLKYNQYQLQQILFQSQNHYVDSIVNQQYLQNILQIILDVKQNFQHINGFQDILNDLYLVVYESSQQRNYVLQMNIYQNSKVQVKVLAYKEYYSFIVEYLLRNIQFPTNNLVSLSSISKYLSNIQIIERTRVINNDLYSQLLRYQKLKINYQQQYIQKIQTKIQATNIQEFFYLILQKVIEIQQSSTQGDIFYSIFTLIQPHFLVDLQLAISMLIFILQKAKQDQTNFIKITTILKSISYQVLFYLRSQQSDSKTINTTTITNIYAEQFISVLLQANIQIKDIFITEQSKIIINQDLTNYELTHYDEYIDLIDFYIFGKQFNLAYEQLLFILQHNQTANALLLLNPKFKNVITKLTSRNNSIILVDEQLVQFFPYNQKLFFNLQEQFKRINFVYGNIDMKITKLQTPQNKYLLKQYKMKKIPLFKLQYGKLYTQQNLNEILNNSQVLQSLDNINGGYSIFIQNLDETTEFQQITSLETIFSNLNELIQDQYSQISLLNKIIPIFIKLKQQAQTQENYLILQVEIILRCHQIILQIFNEDQGLISKYYKIFFIIWLDGCQLQLQFDQMNQSQLEISQSFKDYLSLQFSYTQTKFINLLKVNSILIQDFIGQLSPFQIQEQFVCIYNGYKYITSKTYFKAQGLLLKVIQQSIWHYAHFDLFMRQIGIYFTSKTQKEFHNNDLVAQLVYKIIYQCLQIPSYSNIINKYIEYSINYSSFIIELIQIRDKTDNRKHILQKDVCISSFKFLNSSRQIIVSQTYSNVDNYEILIQPFYIKQFQYKKTYSSKAKPVLYDVLLSKSEEQIILKPDDFTGTDNCLMEYLDNINQFLNFTDYKFKVYYVGQVYCQYNNKFSIVEVLQNLKSVQDLISIYPKINYQQPLPQHSEEQVRLKMQKQLTLSKMRFILFDIGKQINMENHYKTVDSIAAWCVICYLLGIGDRHNNNILFDQQQETVHNIDFEAIFYHAKDLPIPDSCDLRLTPFMMHLLGPAEFETRFKFTSQNILRIIQQNSHIFITSFTAVSQMLTKNKIDIVMKIFDRISNNLEEQYWICIQRSTDEIRLSQMFAPWGPLE